MESLTAEEKCGREVRKRSAEEKLQHRMVNMSTVYDSALWLIC